MIIQVILSYIFILDSNENQVIIIIIIINEKHQQSVVVDVTMIIYLNCIHTTTILLIGLKFILSHITIHNIILNNS